MKYDKIVVEENNPSNLVKMNESFILSNKENNGSHEADNNIDTSVKENEPIILHFTKAILDKYTPRDIYMPINNHDTYNTHSGRLVEYSGTESEGEGDSRPTATRPASPRPSPSASPSPSPTQRRRNFQGEHVLANFGSRTILALLGEALRREDATRNIAFQRVLHDA